jgi:hypothetical protein
MRNGGQVGSASSQLNGEVVIAGHSEATKTKPHVESL